MKSFFLALLAWSFSVVTFAETLPPLPDIAAKSFVLLSYDSGQILQARNPDERIEPASLTKLMTAYITFKALKEGRLKLDQTLPVSERAWKTEGSRMFLEPNKPVTVDELIHGMIVQSGNDACLTLADGIAGSETAFVALMNKEAQRLGLKNTHFNDATGLPDAQHYSTARDLATLAAALIRDFPEDYHLFSIKEYKYNNISQPNRNRLLWQDDYVDGMKTGHTESAGFCLVASAKRGDMRLISAVIGADSDNARTMESQKLLNYGFQFYETFRLYPKDKAVTQLRIWKGSENTVGAGFNHDVYLTLPKGDYANLHASVVSRQPLLAPVTQYQPVGTLKLSLGDKPLVDYPLVALDSVRPASLLGRGWDSLRLLINK
jgi:D-alanyl-D-alanine carboxypeptidase (penicillin-binding protein 5/6)